MKDLLVGQAQNQDSGFEITEMSVKEELSGDWEEKVRARIKQVEQVIVICGEHADIANGVAAELKIAQEEGKPYFLLWGRSRKACVKSQNAKAKDEIYRWTWDSIKNLIGGAR